MVARGFTGVALDMTDIIVEVRALVNCTVKDVAPMILIDNKVVYYSALDSRGVGIFLTPCEGSRDVSCSFP